MPQYHAVHTSIESRTVHLGTSDRDFLCGAHHRWRGLTYEAGQTIDEARLVRWIRKQDGNACEMCLGALPFEVRKRVPT